MSTHVLLNLLNKLEEKIKDARLCQSSYQFPKSLINSIIQEHNVGYTMIRCSIFTLSDNDPFRGS